MYDLLPALDVIAIEYWASAGDLSRLCLEQLALG